MGWAIEISMGFGKESGGLLLMRAVLSLAHPAKQYAEVRLLGKMKGARRGGRRWYRADGTRYEEGRGGEKGRERVAPELPRPTHEDQHQDYVGGGQVGQKGPRLASCPDVRRPANQAGGQQSQTS